MTSDYNEDWCPSSKTNKHYYQPVEIKSNFELFTWSFPDTVDTDLVSFIDNLPTLYERVEYSYLYCNCSAMKKVRV